MRPGRPKRNAHSPWSQAAAAASLTAMLGQGFHAALLDGVTGSGKTEVYLEAVAAVLAADPTAQVLVLLPEIALTQAVLARFEDRFGVAPAEWHSAITPPRRRRASPAPCPAPAVGPRAGSGAARPLRRTG